MAGSCDEFSLSAVEIARYDRQLLLPEFGASGQQRLKDSRALVAGAGGLGSAAAMCLAAAGVGVLGIADFDTVDLTNLQRQMVHGTSSLGKAKTESAEKRLADLNPHVDIRLFPLGITGDNAMEICRDFDIVLGCVDNFAARYAVNAACVRLGIPNVYGSAMMLEGQAGVFCHGGGPCYRCFFRDPPPDGWRPSPAEKGVLGTVPAVIGSIQANEAIKILAGFGRPLDGRLLLYDAADMRFRELAIKKDPGCPVCGRIKEIP